MNTMARKTRQRHLSVRLSGADFAALERAAEASKLPVATWVRQKALQAAEREDPEARKRRAARLVKQLRDLPAFDRGDEWLGGSEPRITVPRRRRP